MTYNYVNFVQAFKIIKNDMNYESLSLRQLKACRVVADAGSITLAAEQLNRTQSAVSKAVAELEIQLGSSLFDRSAQGVEVTPKGRVFIERIRQAEAEFGRAAELHARELRRPIAAHNPVFDMEISRKRLAAFLCLHETLGVVTAAERLGVTRAAVYSSLRTLEHWLDCRLFTSSSAGMAPTLLADGLATHARLALALVRHGLEDLASFEGNIRGRVVIGTLPYARTVLIPRTIDRVLQAHPGLQIATREGPYDSLERSLRNGELDLIIGATRPHDRHSAVTSENLFEDELAVICGAQHPLAQSAALGFADLLPYGWVLPVAQTPARQLFEQWVSEHSATPISQVVETGSLSTIRGLLLESDRLALLSRHQVYHDERAGLLKTLPLGLKGTSRPIGITQRAHTTPSPAARIFIETLRSMAQKLEVSRANQTKVFGRTANSY